MKTILRAAGILGLCSAFLSINSTFAQTREDVELMITQVQLGISLPSSEARETFGLESAQDLRAYNQIIQTGTIDVSRNNQKHLLQKTILPALDLLYSMETRSAAHAHLRGIDLGALKAKRLLAYEILEPFTTALSGPETVGLSTFTGGNITQSSTQILDRACVARISGIASLAGQALDPFSGTGEDFAQHLLYDSLTGDVYLAVAGGTCRPDANDKICSQSDDPLTNDSCDPSTSKYCRLVTTNGVKKCTQASDGAD